MEIDISSFFSGFILGLLGIFSIKDFKDITGFNKKLYIIGIITNIVIVCFIIII